MQPRDAASRLHPSWARHDPVCVGYTVRSTPASVSSDTDACTSEFDARIMHRVVRAERREETVVVDASPCELSAALGVSEAHVRRAWITSESPMALPGPVPVDVPMFAPRESHVNDVSSNSPSSYSPTKSSANTVLGSQKNDVRPARRAPLSPHTLAEYRLLADLLRTELAILAEERGEAVAETERGTTAATTWEASAAQKDPRKLSMSGVARPRCGYATDGCPAELTLSAHRDAVEKAPQGLYRTARARQGVCGPAANNWYAEFRIECAPGEGGLCIGLAGEHFLCTKLLGSREASIGFHSSGCAVASKGEWPRYGVPYGQGDTVGILVRRVGGAPIEVYFFVNGLSCGLVPNTASLDSVPGPLYPAVSLYKPNTRVKLACCPYSWEYFPSASRVHRPLHALCAPAPRVKKAPPRQPPCPTIPAHSAAAAAAAAAQEEKLHLELSSVSSSSSAKVISIDVPNLLALSDSDSDAERVIFRKGPPGPPKHVVVTCTSALTP